ncbi:TetR/AcrR family transcriptional regulator [Novosphingobium sp. 9U]|uniref:TetR/AcrR family transcriptional regulator n=1 Tax=Novosphingobium sp. 9U TaxID=2653158 RepID=UPI0012F2C1D9|nr:TetR/AcrR family transcriptional regulator [Novosphingobium sp. 9U]VWX48249.1 Transcriptional regulator, TetR family [Novosphingobium sp. 9U]
MNLDPDLTPAEAPGPGELALILAAERLFAERGIEGVSLRQINQAANQKNIAAAHYHFGSRDGLVHAVLRHRWLRLDRRRAEMLARTGRTKDIRFYLEAFIEPLTEELFPREEGNYYLRFISQYGRFRLDLDAVKTVTPAGVQIYAEIERFLSYLPKHVRKFRIHHLISLIHSILASAEEQLSNGELDQASLSLTSANMIDMLASALTAPLSGETLDLLRAVESSRRT